MKTIQVKITCGCDHKKNFKFNTNLDDMVVLNVLDSVKKEGYYLGVREINYRPSLDNRTLEWAVDTVKSTRFIEKRWVSEEYKVTAHIVKESDYILLPKDTEFTVSKSPATGYTFFKIDLPKHCPFTVSEKSLIKAFNKNIEVAVNDFYYIREDVNFVVEPSDDYTKIYIHEECDKEVIKHRTVCKEVEL